MRRERARALGSVTKKKSCDEAFYGDAALPIQSNSNQPIKSPLTVVASLDPPPSRPPPSRPPGDIVSCIAWRIRVPCSHAKWYYRVCMDYSYAMTFFVKSCSHPHQGQPFFAERKRDDHRLLLRRCERSVFTLEIKSIRSGTSGLRARDLFVASFSHPVYVVCDQVNISRRGKCRVLATQRQR